MTEEDKIQMDCVKWFRIQYPNEIIFAVPNGGSRNLFEAVKLKKTGTLAGVADLFLAKPSKGFSGLFIEVKQGRNKQTQTQKDFEQIIKLKGYEYRVVYSLDEFMDLIYSYL